MADSLTQLQDSLDNLLELMHDALIYVQTRHPYGDIPGQPIQAPEAVSEAELRKEQALTNGAAAHTQQEDQEKPPPPPAPPQEFAENMRESANKIVMQQRDIETIIEALPGIAKTEAQQGERMRQLEVELREEEKRRAKAEEERERMIDLLGNMIVGAKREP